MAKRRKKTQPSSPPTHIRRRFLVGQRVYVARYDAFGTIHAMIDRWQEEGVPGMTKTEYLPHGWMYDVNIKGRPLDSEPLWESELTAVE